MPAGKGSSTDSGGNKTVNRETFRPPWVKDGTESLPPKPSNLSTKSKKETLSSAEPPKDTRPSWVKNRKSSTDEGDSEAPIAGLRKVTVKTNQNQENGNGKESTFVRPQLKKVPPKEQAKPEANEGKIQVKLSKVADRPPLNKVRTINKEDMEIDKVTPRERNAIVRQESLKKIPPKAPPMPPPAPAFPHPTELKPLSHKQKAVIDLLKARPKVRPDWTAMLKEVESGRKLKHVECNDRSQPLLTKTKEESQFIYESEKSEKDVSHNQLIKEIQQGVALRKTKTNDRSKPILEGLRKFRRQMTIEEQIIKSQSMASIPPEEIANEEDELDDIDKVRDDLQSTKQMLALELRNKEALNRDNKRYQARVAQLEAELEKENVNKKPEGSQTTDANDKLVTSLKSEAAEARKTAQELEKKFHDAADQLDHTKSELEEVRKQKQLLEKKLQESVPSNKRISISERKESIAKQSESEDELEVTEPESEGSDNEEKLERKAQRELKQLRNKLRSYINKEDTAKQERMALKRQIKQLHLAMRAEKKKYKMLQKEVSKMEAMMKEVGDESDDEREAEKEESEADETESETESSETESDSEGSDSEPEDATVDKKNSNLTERVKKHEGRFSALKKGNFMLKANVERLQDDLNKQKEDSVTLQRDLDSVLAELD